MQLSKKRPLREDFTSKISLHIFVNLMDKERFTNFNDVFVTRFS